MSKMAETNIMAGVQRLRVSGRKVKSFRPAYKLALNKGKVPIPKASMKAEPESGLPVFAAPMTAR
jgi:hypothetical protein